MRVHFTESPALIWATDISDLTRLSAVRAPIASAPAVAIEHALDVHEGHVWLHRHIMASLGPDEPEWATAFEAMVAYAERSGWVSEGMVRMHLEG